jgi:carboxylesterase
MAPTEIIPGAESFLLEGNDVGCLVVHGFTSSPQMIRDCAEQLHRDGGFTVLAPLLAGHGTVKEDLLPVRAKDWVNQLIAGVSELEASCSPIVVTGLSPGGICTLFMAGFMSDRIAAAIPINAPGQMGTPDTIATMFDPNEPSEYPNGEPDILKPDVHEILYDAMPVAAYQQAYLLGSAAFGMLPRVTCPMLVMQSRQDKWVDPKNAPVIIETINSEVKQLLWLENSGHIATLDYDRELIGQEAISFIRAHT